MSLLHGIVFCGISSSMTESKFKGIDEWLYFIVYNAIPYFFMP